ETRSEHQRFLQRLEGRSAGERRRLQKEHTDFLAGRRDTDADFGDDCSSPPARTPRPYVPPPMGKSVSFMERQKQLASEQRRVVAAKTLAGSGKKAHPRRKQKSVHAEFISEDEADDEDDDYEDEEANEYDDDEKELED
ncbi:hypothetical protein PHYSODRAFT_376373, partial [Phytophthora sojae]